VKRLASSSFRSWAARADRRPLVVRGARQVGKTWLVEATARECVGDVVTLDLERHARARELFADPSPRKILAAIEALLGKRVEAGKCVLFLDEIQAAPEALSRLRYFHEELPQLHVAAAGSLLDFALAEHASSMPVGRIEYLYVEPLGFAEFVGALEGEVILDVLRDWRPGEPIAGPVHERLLGLCREYALVGGMPAVVDRYRSSRSLVDAAPVQQNLLTTLRDDFAKYGTRAAQPRLLKVLDSVARQAGRKFMFVQVDREQRSAVLREALDCLCRARICHRVYGTHGNGLPFAAEVDERNFKVLMLDTGLLLAAQGLLWQENWRASDLMLVNEGALAEHLTGQMLRALAPSFVDSALYYWTRQQRGAEAEVDYLIANGTEVVPVEVKSGKAGTLRSLHRFVAEKGARLAVRVSSEPPQLADVKTAVPGFEPRTFRLLSIPFYLIGELPRVLAGLGAAPREAKRRRRQH